MTVLGKVIGGGMPLAAFRRPRAVMEQLAPLGPVYQAGTLSGNPVATACGLATLREISRPVSLMRWPRPTRRLVDGLAGAAQAEGVPFSADCEGGMFGFFLLPELPQNYAAGHEDRWRPLQHPVPRPAGPRRLHRAGAVRSRLCERRPHRSDIAETVAAARDAFKAL
jgi:glutamate-1-semialdehyde 2,1-aminomutase